MSGKGRGQQVGPGGVSSEGGLTPRVGGGAARPSLKTPCLRGGGASGGEAYKLVAYFPRKAPTSRPRTVTQGYHLLRGENKAGEPRKKHGSYRGTQEGAPCCPVHPGPLSWERVQVTQGGAGLSEQEPLCGLSQKQRAQITATARPLPRKPSWGGLG